MRGRGRNECKGKYKGAKRKRRNREVAKGERRGHGGGERARERVVTKGERRDQGRGEKPRERGVSKGEGSG